MIVFPNAKLNLGLRIVSKREDAFHNIESVFLPLPLRDVLEVVKDKKQDDLLFSTSGIPVEGETESNLCVKAYYLLRTRYAIGGVQCHLHKNIPMGAGLGGGSADGAFMIRALGELFDLKLGKEEMHFLALRLGSDCAYFLHNVPSLVEGRGEKISKVDFSLHGKFLVLVHPGIHVNTREAYSTVKPGDSTEGIPEILKLPEREWRFKLKNDFEESVFKTHPEIAEVKELLYSLGAVYASMSGSGSAVFGLFDEPVNDLSQHFQGYFVFESVL